MRTSGPIKPIRRDDGGDVGPLISFVLYSPFRRPRFRRALGRCSIPSALYPPLLTRSSSRLSVSAGADKVRLVSNRSEEHTSELQSLAYLVCRLLLEKKKKRTK